MVGLRRNAGWELPFARREGKVRLDQFLPPLLHGRAHGKDGIMSVDGTILAGIRRRDKGILSEYLTTGGLCGMVVRTKGVEMKTADGKPFELGMEVFYPASGRRFPLAIRTSPDRHTICTTPQGPALAASATTIPIAHFHSTLESALAVLAEDIKKRQSEISQEIQKLREEGFSLGATAYALGKITTKVACGQLSFIGAEKAYFEATGTPVETKEPPPQTYASSTLKKRREPKPTAKSVAEIIG
jgi:hypothetical protein